MNMLPNDPNYCFLFLNCDNLISHFLPKFTRLAATMPKSIIHAINISDDTSIKDNVSFRASKDCIGFNKANRLAFTYSCVYNNLNIQFYDSPVDKVDATFIKNRFSSYANGRYSFNPIIITSSTTPQHIIEDLQKVQATNGLKSLCHIHCDTGNENDGGAIYTRISGYKNNLSTDFPEDFSNFNEMKKIKAGDIFSPRMLPQASIGAGILFNIITNLVSFAKIDTTVKRFSFNKMCSGEKIVDNYSQPVKLLDSDDGFYVMVIGTGGTGSLMIEECLQQASNNYSKINGITLIDGDIFERKNLRNQACTLSEINDKKCKVIKNRFQNSIDNVFPNISLTYYDQYIRKFNEETILDSFSLFGYVPLSHLVEDEINDIYLDYKNYTVVSKGNIIQSINEDTKILSTLEPNDKVRVYEIHGDYAFVQYKHLKTLKDKNLIVITTVDNDETRKEIDNFLENSETIHEIKNCIHIDSGNGTDVRAGQTYIGYKQYGKTILNSIAHSDLDNGKILSNMDDINIIGTTCANEFDENPQNIATNSSAQMSANMYLSYILLDNAIPAHYSTFNADINYLSTFANPIECV